MSGHFLLDLLAAIALLLWATRLVRTGIERAFGERLRALVARATHTPITALLAGIAVAAALQSATAAALLVSGFIKRRFVTLPAALAVMLGADIGSSIVVQLLAFDLKLLIPMLFIGGVALFMLAKPPTARMVGRVIIGAGLMMLALSLIVGASHSLRQQPILLLALEQLEHAPLAALLIGAALTWLVHSSVAMILFFTSLASAGLLTLPLTLALILGANVGSGVIALALAGQSDIQSRRMLWGNFVFRLCGALAIIGAIDALVPWLMLLQGGMARQSANFHTLFNVLVAACFLPWVAGAARLLSRVFPEPAAPVAERYIAHLDEEVLDRPAIALAGASREVLRLADTVEIMLREALCAFSSADQQMVLEVKQLDRRVDLQQEAIKLYLTRLTRQALQEEDARRAFDLILFTTHLEHIGDILDKSFLELAAKKQRLKLQFSPEGWQELQRLHRLAVEHMRLAISVFVNQDLEMARALVTAKDRLRAIEREATQSHLRRLREGRVASIETSSLHLDMLRDLKQIVAHLTSVAHPILEAKGELHASRLRPLAAEGISQEGQKMITIS
jgi:phosphate:Na+ symporter